VEKGFDFLGQNVRRYPNGKLLIKPSRKNVKTFLDGIRRTIKAALGFSAADLNRRTQTPRYEVGLITSARCE